MKISISPLFGGVILLGFLILAFALIRGCNQGKAKDEAYAKSLAKNTELEEKLKAADSASLANKNNYNASLEFANGVIALKDNQVQSTRAELEAANIRIEALLKRHKSVQPDTNSTVTLVPNEYIEECAECFAELEYHKGKSARFIKETDSLHAAHLAKESLQQKRITQLQQENSHVSKTLTDCLTAGKAQAGKLETRRKVYLTMGAIWAPLPKAIGVGLLYQDKRGRMYGGKAYTSAWGTLVESELILPLSFRRK